ncbi:unnamed protein product [Acanthoscelides obtectus]|uniref:Uncharacterized protein n=1 Tax=Acanthoscelides obtectus TaxID=200917 RepID=A0A9P0MFN8_ACAOB|nr:unnamed protein product [Acanthoscelides obtectus]CAK1666827.1 hypothetical protein AOBTE_LOCUS25503 [Acanthoscelides obtectus]
MQGSLVLRKITAWLDNLSYNMMWKGIPLEENNNPFHLRIQQIKPMCKKETSSGEASSRW